MEAFQTLCLLLGTSFTAGIRVYGTVAGLGIAHRYIDGFSLPANLEILGNPVVIGVAATLYIAETLGDKVPLLNTVLDSVQAVIKPVVMGVLAYWMIPESNAVAQVVAGVGAGGVSLTTHMTNVVLRGPSKAEPVSNRAGSAVEDVGFLGGMWLLITHPVIMAALVIAFLIVAIWILRRTARALKSVFRFFFRKPAKLHA